MAGRTVRAAGAVVFRADETAGEREVLLVHRPRYGDWTLPKGKLDRDEYPQAAAVREVREETGVSIRLGLPLGAFTYPVGGSPKRVHWWIGHALSVEDRPADREVDDVAWVPASEARTRMTYPDEVGFLDKALDAGRSGLLLVVRHAKAKDRAKYHGTDDALRPLSSRGAEQAVRLVDLLGAYGATEIVSSSSTRCLDTVKPYADSRETPVRAVDLLSQERGLEHPGQVRKYLERLTSYAAHHPSGSVIVCGHRPVLPDMFAGVGIAPVAMQPAQVVAVHLSDDRDADAGAVVAVEEVPSPH